MWAVSIILRKIGFPRDGSICFDLPNLFDSETKIKTVKISVNTRENFDLDAVNNNGETVVESHGYMPHWVHGYNYGVFDLEIDNETGKILNWVPLTKEEIEKKIKDLE